MNSRTILVTGATGLLGPYLLEAAAGLGRVVGAARSGADLNLDLCDAPAVKTALQSLAPDLVIHAAALTNVDQCQEDPATAMRMNRDAVSNVIQALGADARFVLISTDQVYPDLPGPHGEKHTGPVNEYGASKLAGEAAALANPHALVLRTNLFGPSRTPGRTSLSDFFITALGQGKPVTLFEDILFSPLHMATLGKLLVKAVELDLTGVYNLGSRAGMSKKDFALAVASRKSLPTTSAVTGRSTTILARASRPKDMRLDVSRMEQALGRTMPTLLQEIERL